MMVPSAHAQAEVITHAYAQAGIKDLNQTSYFECHGTGTFIGDLMEVLAVAKMFAPTRDARDPLCLGSVRVLAKALNINGAECTNLF